MTLTILVENNQPYVANKGLSYALLFSCVKFDCHAYLELGMKHKNTTTPVIAVVAKLQ